MRVWMLAAALATATATTAAAQPRTGPEAVYSAAARRDGLSVVVASNGCTRRADFRVERRPGGVILRRVRPDHCKAFVASGVRLTFGWRELGAGAHGGVRLLNPLTADPSAVPTAP